MRPFFTSRRVILPSLLVIGLTIVAPPPTQALGGRQPRIRNLVTAQAAAGFGQLVTIQGFNIFSTATPGVTRVRITQGAVASDAFVFQAPSNPNEVYVRLPNNLVPGNAFLTVRTTDDNLVSAPFPFRVSNTPGTPIMRDIVSVAAGNAVITSAQRGSNIGIRAYGTDTAGATAIFTQAAGQITVTSVNTFSSPTIGVVSAFTVPTTLTPGIALVQLRVRVDGVDSNSSFSMLLIIT